MSNQRRGLCLVYAALAVVALLATWSQTIQYFLPLPPGGLLATFPAFVFDLQPTAASRSIAVDILLFGLAGTVFMVLEARRLSIRFVWAYVILGLLVAISVTFPLFMLARELRLAQTGEPEASLGGADLVGLAAMAAAVLWLCAVILRMIP